MKDKLFVMLGARGGQATAKKYGSAHYKKLSKLGREALRKKYGEQTKLQDKG